MYEYIKGIITDINKKYIVVENNNIGYILNVSNIEKYKIHDVIKIYVYRHIKEEIDELYGFKTYEEKELFLKFLAVSGIGPKIGLSILNSSNIFNILKAIRDSDYLFFKRIPGIGEKASKQIILDLKGKIDIKRKENESKYNDCFNALISLGYLKKDIADVLNEIDLNQEEGLILKDAIKKINK